MQACQPVVAVHIGHDGDLKPAMRCRTLEYDIIDVMSPRGSDIYALLQLVRPIVLHSARVVEEEVRALGWTVGCRLP
jgi:hypothetical protein